MTKRTERMPLGLLWVICEVAVWGLAMGYIQLLFSPLNQVFLFWTRLDALLLAVLLFSQGTVIWGLTLLLRRWVRGRWRDILPCLFFFWAVLVVANWFPSGRLVLVRHAPWLTGTRYYLLLWSVGLAVSAAVASTSAGRRFSRLAWHALAYAWMLPPVLAAALFFFSPARPPTSQPLSGLPRRPDAAGDAPAPVLLVVLDMIADSEVVDANGTVGEDLPHLRAFAAASTYCSRTSAPGLQTAESMPGICLQFPVGIPHVDSGGQVSWPVKDSDSCTPRITPEDCPEAPTRVVRLAGGRSVICSEYLPWADWFTGEWAWDAACTHCYYGAAPVGSGGWRTVLGRLILVADQWAAASKTPQAGAIKALRLHLPFSRVHYASVAHHIQEEGASFLRRAFSPGDFAILHQPLPHPPFVFDENGGFHPLLPETAASYRQQLRYADVLFGRWMDDLRASGLWDASWVLVTSDHGLHDVSWSSNPDRHDKSHVPLWIKAPGQVSPSVLEQPVHLEALGELPFSIWPFPHRKGDAPNDLE